MSDLCPVCSNMFKDGSINHGSMTLYIHEEVPSDNFFDKGLGIATRTYRFCSLVKDTREKSRGYFCIYPRDPAKEQGMDHITLLFEKSLDLKQAAEINNALAVILGNAQLLLLKNAVAPEDRAKLKAIEQSSFRIQRLVKRMLWLNR